MANINHFYREITWIKKKKHPHIKAKKNKKELPKSF